MKQNNGFLLKEISGVPYLLPYGQMIADHRRGIQTNATGVYLWNLLTEELSLKDILSLSAAHYEISEPELPAFQNEISQFLHHLLSLGILTDSAEQTDNSILQQLPDARNNAIVSQKAQVFSGSKEHFLSIGGLALKLIAPPDAFPREFSDFVIPETSNLPIKQTIILHPEMPTQPLHGQILLHHSELTIVEQEEQYLLYFGAAHKHLEIYLSKDASTAHCYCLPPYSEQFCYDFFHAIRLLYLYLAQQHGMVALHSASILYQNRLFLFSGHSGIGKSTHTNLWKQHYTTPVINGDLNLLAIENGQPVVHGIPWCGSSEIYSTKTYPLGGIILLEQAPENSIEQLRPDQKRLLVSQRLISPSFTKELWQTNLSALEPWIDSIPVCKLHCTKEKEAAELIKKEIDTFLV